MSTRAQAVRAWGVNPLVSEEVNKPTLDEDGYLPENTERGHQRCAVSAGAPPLVTTGTQQGMLLVGNETTGGLDR